jgi:hypothetical protein
MPESTEWLTYTIDPVSPESAAVHLRWEKLDVAFTVAVDVQGIVIARLEKAVTDAKPDDWRTLFQAARVLQTTSTTTSPAPSSGPSRRTGSRRASGRSRSRRGSSPSRRRRPRRSPLLEKAIEVAKGKAPPEYLDGLGKLLAEWKKG